MPIITAMSNYSIKDTTKKRKRKKNEYLCEIPSNLQAESE